MADPNKVCCPHCNKSIGGTAKDGGVRIRLGILLIDEDSGRIHGPCPQCKQDVVVGDNSGLNKCLLRGVKPLVPGLRHFRR
jgi:endogenous inhibitor of DNA gyrase (YacG/DUF329 family)